MVCPVGAPNAFTICTPLPRMNEEECRITLHALSKSENEFCYHVYYKIVWILV